MRERFQGGNGRVRKYVNVLCVDGENVRAGVGFGEQEYGVAYTGKEENASGKVG